MKIVMAQLAEVLEEIAAEHDRAGAFQPVAELRKGAVSAVAERYGVDSNTIADGFIRRLRPQIASTAEFDDAVHEWLRGKPRKLWEALVAKGDSKDDVIRVSEVINARGR